MNNLLEGLTERQTQGVLVEGRPSIVTAGAGAGKTGVLTRKISKILLDNQSSQVLALTFTKKAAGEMAERIEGFVGQRLASQCVCSTFHSFSLRYILEPNWHHPFFQQQGINSPKIDICSNPEAYITHAFATALKRRDKRLLDGFEVTKDVFKSWLSIVRANGLTPYSYLKLLAPDYTREQLSDFPVEHPELKNVLLLRIWFGYHDMLRSNNQIDLDELTVLAKDFLTEVPEVAEALRMRFSTILVDEFQDTCLCQYAIVMQIVRENANNLCIFGDGQQAIYAFRGASCYLLSEFPNQFDDVAIVNLPDNFRSTEAIVQYANAISGHMAYRLSSEDMISHKQTIEPVQSVSFRDEYEEAQWIVTKIMSKIQSGIKPPDIAVLYRNKSMKQAIEQELVARRVKYTVVGEIGLFEEEPIKCLVAFMHVLFRPTNLDALSKLCRSANLPIDRVTIGNYIKKCKAKGVTANSHHLISVISKQNDGVSDSLRTLVNNLSELIMRLAGKIERLKNVHHYFEKRKLDRDNVSDELKAETEGEFFQEIGAFVQELANSYLEIILCHNAEDMTQRNQIAQLQLETVEKNMSCIFKALSNFAVEDLKLLEYMQNLPLFEDKREDKPNTTDLELMTVHKSKGLEKEVIFVCGLSEENWIKEVIKGTDEYEETLRLFYVAVTRAISYLYLTYYNYKEVRSVLEEMTKLHFLDFATDRCDSFHYVQGGLLSEDEYMARGGELG